MHGGCLCGARHWPSMDASLKMSIGYVSGQVASNRWKFPDEEKTPVMNENIISLFDQLCYVVVFGNVSSMMERVPQAERDVFFAGVRKFAIKMRKNGEYSKRLIERSTYRMDAFEKVKAKASCAVMFEDTEAWIKGTKLHFKSPTAERRHVFVRRG